MAWNPFGVQFELEASGSSVTRTSATKFTVKVTAHWETYYEGAQTNYGMTASSGGGSVNLNTFGTYSSSGTGSFTGTYSISGNGKQTKTITVTFKNFNNDNDDSATTTVSFDVSVPAWTSYTVSYNANGGSGAPSSQTKWKDQTLTLSSTKPTRTGYTFKGWGTSASDTTVDYAAGASYTANAGDTLYAIWSENILTVNYYSNYATSAFDDALNSVGASKNVKVWTYDFYYDNDYSAYGMANYSGSSGSVYMTRTGYTATGKWGTSTNGGKLVDEDTGFATGQAVAEAFGKSLKSGSVSLNVYAQWEENMLTANYYSNYATSAYDGTVNEVGADKNVIVRTYSWTYSSDALASGLHNYSTEGDTTYLGRERYNATGYWGTELEGGILVHEDTGFDSGQSLAEAFGLSLENKSQTIDIYAQWTPAASRVTVYLPDDNGNVIPHTGTCYFYDENGDVRYAILTLYGEDGSAHIVV